MTQVEPVPELIPPPTGLGLEDFGHDFMRLVLHRDRIMASIDRILGEDFALGPIGAGPGRRLARATARGRYGKTYGEELPDPELGYRVFLPVDVDFDLDLHVDNLRFHADLIVPIEIRMRVERPLTIHWDITPPTPESVVLKVNTSDRRSAIVQRVAGIDDELRRFLVRFVTRELEKPHVVKATRLDLLAMIDNAWPALADQFLPNSPEDRLG